MVNASAADASPAAPSLREALTFWLRLGCISFGGPAGQIALMHDELVVRRRWIGERRFLHALNYCMMLPGPEAQQLATYMGWLLHGVAGGIAAALCGMIASRWLSNDSLEPSPHAPAARYEAAFIDDDSPLPAHARFQPVRSLVVVAVGIIAWCVPMALLVLGVGLQHIYSEMSWFFTKAALLTFGGAYAVLPYVHDGAVQHFGWITPEQMMDGLALGESTPGPLIMVVAFIGFLGAWAAPPLGPEHVVAGSVIAALLVTWFTFLPSFVFILAGAPWVETTRANWRLAAPLTAISAAVVGVILSLALVFATRVLWPSGFSANPDVPSLVIALAALIALFRYGRGVVETLALAGCAGIAFHLLGRVGG
jgi:chromate transporter